MIIGCRRLIPGSLLIRALFLGGEGVWNGSAYLTSIQNTSCDMLGWVNHKLDSRLLGEISVISDMQMIPLNDRK